MMCSLCGEAFQRGDVIVTFCVWPQGEQVGHAACVVAHSIGDPPPEDDENG
jgi:hypothetical protein